VPEISRGSVATRLRCGGIFNDGLITNLLMSLRWQNFDNLSLLDCSGPDCGVIIFDHGVQCMEQVCEP